MDTKVVLRTWASLCLMFACISEAGKLSDVMRPYNKNYHAQLDKLGAEMKGLEKKFNDNMMSYVEKKREKLKNCVMPNRITRDVDEQVSPEKINNATTKFAEMRAWREKEKLDQKTKNNEMELKIQQNKVKYQQLMLKFHQLEATCKRNTLQKRDAYSSKSEPDMVTKQRMKRGEYDLTTDELIEKAKEQAEKSLREFREEITTLKGVIELGDLLMKVKMHELNEKCIPLVSMSKMSKRVSRQSDDPEDELRGIEKAQERLKALRTKEDKAQKDREEANAAKLQKQMADIKELEGKIRDTEAHCASVTTGDTVRERGFTDGDSPQHNDEIQLSKEETTSAHDNALVIRELQDKIKEEKEEIAKEKATGRMIGKERSKRDYHLEQLNKKIIDGYKRERSKWVAPPPPPPPPYKFVPDPKDCWKPWVRCKRRRRRRSMENILVMRFMEPTTRDSFRYSAHSALGLYKREATTPAPSAAPSGVKSSGNSSITSDTKVPEGGSKLKEGEPDEGTSPDKEKEKSVFQKIMGKVKQFIGMIWKKIKCSKEGEKCRYGFRTCCGDTLYCNPMATKGDSTGICNVCVPHGESCLSHHSCCSKRCIKVKETGKCGMSYDDKQKQKKDEKKEEKEKVKQRKKEEDKEKKDEKKKEAAQKKEEKKVEKENKKFDKLAQTNPKKEEVKPKDKKEGEKPAKTPAKTPAKAPAKTPVKPESKPSSPSSSSSSSATKTFKKKKNFKKKGWKKKGKGKKKGKWKGKGKKKKKKIVQKRDGDGQFQNTDLFRDVQLTYSIK